MTVTAQGLLVAGGDHALVSVDTTTGTTRWSVDIRTGTHPEQCPWMAVAAEVDRLYCGNYFGLMEERDLTTGQRTGVRFDPQLGSVGDLAVTPDGGELVAFAVQAPVISHWRLDGSGPMTRLVAEGRTAVEGYDPSGRALIVGEPVGVTSATGTVDPTVWDPVADQLIEPIAPASVAVWIRSDLVGVMLPDGRIGVYDLDQRALAMNSQQDSEGVTGAFVSADRTRVYVAYDRSQGGTRRSEVRTFDIDDGTRLEPTFEIEGLVSSLSTTADGSRIAVTVDQDATSVYDARTAERVGGPLEGIGLTVISPDDALFLGGDAGAIVQYDLDTLRPTGTFPGARGMIESLQFSEDGRVLAATSRDLTVSLYDVGSRTRLGDPLPSAAVASTGRTVQGWLRPDGTNVAIDSRLGITVWDVDPAHLADAACEFAGRNLTRTEWNTYLSDLGPYRSTCADLPPPTGD
jgi:WD40 repeat protein